MTATITRAGGMTMVAPLANGTWFAAAGAQVPDETWQPVPTGARVLTFPWSVVMHDNHRLQPAKGRKGLIATNEYRTKKGNAATLAGLQWGRLRKLTGDVSLTARCYFPDRRKRDAGNYRKLITDALSGIVYADDAQLEVETWRRAGIVAKADARIEVLLYSQTEAAR
jgi:Holliday junction resolvase RusA-like endonuclease